MISQPTASRTFDRSIVEVLELTLQVKCYKVLVCVSVVDLTGK